MEKKVKGFKIGLMVGILRLMTASPVFARSLIIKETASNLWIFFIIGAVIVLLQLIPAAILFFSTAEVVFKPKRTEEAIVIGTSPVVVKN